MPAAAAEAGSRRSAPSTQAASMRVMSASAIVVHVADVCSECSMCSPIDWRIRDIPRCVVSTEYDATGIEAVSLVMAPKPSEALSTFAGLGSA